MRDIMKLLQQAQDSAKKVQDELEAMTVTGTSGGGMVSADVNGQGVLKRVKIDPSVVNPADTEMLEDLIAVAVNEAQRKAQEKAQEQVTKAAGVNLPFKLPF